MSCKPSSETVMHAAVPTSAELRVGAARGGGRRSGAAAHGRSRRASGARGDSRRSGGAARGSGRRSEGAARGLSRLASGARGGGRRSRAAAPGVPAGRAVVEHEHVGRNPTGTRERELCVDAKDFLVEFDPQRRLQMLCQYRIIVCRFYGGAFNGK